MSNNLKLKICYDGNFVNGWHGDKGNFVKNLLENAFEKLTQQKLNFNCSGRTDAGVHALGQICNVIYEGNLSLEKIKSGLNAYLPSYIKVLEVSNESLDFHARFSTKQRYYIYKLYISRVSNPFLKNYALQYYYNLNIDKITELMSRLEGTFDFASFCPNKYKGKTLKTMDNCFLTIEKDNLNNNLLLFHFKAKSFAYHQIRNLVGAILLVGKGTWSIDEFFKILEQKNRNHLGKMVEPYGLYLVSCGY